MEFDLDKYDWVIFKRGKLITAENIETEIESNIQNGEQNVTYKYMKDMNTTCKNEAENSKMITTDKYEW